MRVLEQNNTLINIKFDYDSNVSPAKHEMYINVLEQILEVHYPESVLNVTYGTYGVPIDIQIKFSNIEEAVKFKLTYM